MATATLGGVIAAARQLIPPDPDADLLRRFAATRDDDAFAVLVARYGRLVLSACRRIVPDTHLADDAFQATFVVLATKAATLDGSRPLGPWLYSVASHVATRARAMIGRRRKRETLTGTVPDGPAPASCGTGFQAGDDDSAAILDEEIGRLSAACRDAVVLCELQGLTRKQAAAKLGIAEGTLSSRLAAARKTLAVRLKARGVAPAVGVISALFVPTDLVAATVAASTGKVLLSPQLTALVQKGLAMTLFAKLKLVPAVVALGLLLLGAAGWGGSSSDTAVAAPVPKAEKDDGLIWMLDGKTGALTAFAPDGTKKQDVVLKSLRNFKGFTRDGESLLFLAKKGELSDAEDGLTLHIGTPGDLTKATDTGIEWNANDPCTYMLTRDRTRVVLERHVRALGNALPVMPTSPSFTHTVVDLATKKESELSLPGHSQLWSESPDGKDWIVMAYNNGPKLPGYCYMRVPVAGGKPVPICETHQFPFLMPSPDGKSYLGIGIPFPVKEGVKGFNLYHFDPATGKATELEQFADFEQRNHRWSPDGTRYAVKKHGDADVFAADIDGKNRRKLFAVPDAGPESFLIGWFPTKPKAVAPQPKKNAPVPKDAPDAGLIWTHHTETNALTAYTPDGKAATVVKLPVEAKFIGFTPDGARMMFVGMKGKLPLPDADGPLTMHVGDIDAACEGTDTGLGWQRYDEFIWSPDGKQVVRSRRVANGERPRLTFEHTLFDLSTKKEAAIELPPRHQLMQWSADGKTWRVMYYNRAEDPKLPNYRWCSMPAGGGELTPVCDDASVLWLDPHPDGKRFLVAPFRPAGVTPGKFTLETVADGKSTVLSDVPADVEGVVCADARWSPDGARTAALWYGIGTQAKPLGDTLLAVFDGDGKDKKTLLTLTADGQRTRLLGWFPTKPKRNAPVPKGGPDAGLLWTHNRTTGKLVAYTPDGKKAKELDLPDGDRFVGFTPDGTRMLFAGKDGKAADPGATDGLTLHIRGITGKAVGTDTGFAYKPGDQFVPSPDGKRIVRQRLDQVGGAKASEHSHVLFDVATKKETKIDLPTDCQILQWTPDGKAWRVLHYNVGTDPKLPHYRWLQYPAAGGKPTPLCDTHSLYWLDPSADGTEFVGTGFDHPAGAAPEACVFRVTAATGKVVQLVKLEKLSYAVTRSSPDGKRIAAMKYALGGPGDQAGDTRLTLYDADGKNETAVADFPADGQTTAFLGWFPTKPTAPVPK